MINLTTSGNSIIFTFQDNQHYLQNGTIEVPKNSLLLVTDDSNMATFKKSASNDIFISALYSELGMSKSELEAWFEENATTNYGGGGGGDITSGEVQTMIDESISGKADVSSLATVATTGDYDDLLNKPTIPVVPTSNTAFTNDAGYITEDAISGKADTSAVTAVNDVLTAHTANTTIHVTAGDKLTWDGKQDALTAGVGIDITNDVISCTVTGGGNNVVELTQAQYDALVDKDPDAFYIITDAPAIDLSGYAQTSAVTAEITAAVSGKQDTLSAGTGIDITNNVISATGGGATYSAGTNISIANDTISCKIPYSDVVYDNTDIILGKNMPSVSDYNRVCYGKRIASRANSSFGHSIGIGVPPSSSSSDYNELYGSQSIGIGAFKIGNGSQYSDFVRGCVAIGYGAKTRISGAVAIGIDTEASGTTKTNINNQLKIDTSNQVYIYNKDNTEMICLQDNLGGGASSAITSGDTNAVAGGAVYDKFDEVEQVTAAALNALNDNFGGLKLVKLTQQEYDDLAVKNNNILYVVI